MSFVLRSFTYAVLLVLFPKICASMVIIGDVNQDGAVDLLDVSPFVDAISSGDYQVEADMNEDGSVDLLDVSPFVDVLSGSAPRIAILKDSLDPQNFKNLWAGGGFISPDPVNSSLVDGRTHIGIEPTHKGRLARLTLNFVTFRQSTNQPNNEPARSLLFDLRIAHYDSFVEAVADPLRVDGVFPESTQPQDIFENPVGQTASGGPFNSIVANVFQAKYDLSALNLTVTPEQINYLGISATSVSSGTDFQPQRSDDSGFTIGTFEDFLSGSILPPGLSPMSDFYDDSIQNSVRITMIIDE